MLTERNHLPASRMGCLILKSLVTGVVMVAIAKVERARRGRRDDGGGTKEAERALWRELGSLTAGQCRARYNRHVI